VNLKSDKEGTHEVSMLFNWFLAGTNKSVTPEKFFFTIYDSDSSATAKEQVTFYNPVNSVYAAKNSELKMSGDQAMGLTFTSSTDGNGYDVPLDTKTLTKAQQARAVTVDFKDTSMFKVSFTVLGGKKGRNFVFGGKTVLADSEPSVKPSTTATTTPCETQSCQVWADPHVSGFDNSDNQGPDSLALLSMKGNTVGNTAVGAFTFDGRPVDLNAYDTGDFWLVKSEPVHIQARFRLSGEFIPDRAAIGAVAVGGPFLKGHRLLFEPLDGKVTFDGKDAKNGWWWKKNNLLSMRENESSIEVELPMGITLLLRRLDKHVDVKITMPQIPGGVDGECGNYDGIAENDEENGIQGRMGSMMIESHQLLFAKENTDQSGDLFELAELRRWAEEYNYSNEALP